MAGRKGRSGRRPSWQVALEGPKKNERKTHNEPWNPKPPIPITDIRLISIFKPCRNWHPNDRSEDIDKCKACQAGMLPGEPWVGWPDNPWD